MQAEVNIKNLVQRYLPKQVDLDKVMKIIQREILKDTYLPVTVKEIQTGCLNSSYIKDVYLYLVQNKLWSHEAAIGKPRH